MPTDARTRQVELALLALALLGVTWRAAVTWDTVVDDAWISARYADHLVEGHGLVYNAGEPPVEGYTNLAFTAMLAGGRLLGLPMHALMTGLGFFWTIVAIAVSWPLTAALSGRRGPVTAVPALVLAASPHLAVASTNGIESTMMVAAVMLALWLHLAGRRGLAAAAAALLVLTRPEGVVVGGLLLAHGAWRHRSEPRRTLPLAVGVVGTALGLTLFRYTTYGLLLPNTFYAKSSFPLSETFQVNGVYLGPEQATLWAGLAAAVLTGLVPPFSLGRALTAALALLLGAIPLTVNLWMPGLRLFLPALALAATGLVAALASRDGVRQHLPWLLVPAMVAFHVVAGERVRNYDWRHSVQPGNGTEIAARHLAAHAPPGAWLATRDAGCFAYWVGTGVKVAELHQRALTQPHPDGENAAALSYTPTNPTFFVATVRREATTRFDYGNDRQIFDRMTAPYDYLGRVYQHFHRYYDVYALGEVAVPPLPARHVVNRVGPAPRGPGDRAPAPPPADDAPEEP